MVKQGDVFAGYRIDDVLGRGSLGITYSASELQSGPQVALKVISLEVSEDPWFSRQFRREMGFALSLRHPHVLQVEEAGEHDEHLFVAMPIVDGISLERLTEDDTALPPRRATRIVGHIAQALGAIHDHGRRPRIGQARERARRPCSDGAEHGLLKDIGLPPHAGSRGLTEAQTAGSSDYVAPELIRGDPSDSRADVYALGCVLYEALTGHTPFRVKGPAAKMYAHLSTPVPSLAEWGVAAAPVLDPVIALAMAKEPDDRYGSAADLARDAAARRRPRLAAVSRRRVPRGRACGSACDSGARSPARRSPRSGRPPPSM